MIWTVKDKPSPTGKPRATIVLLLQRGKPHSKYHDLTCFCTRKRKDGSCRHTDLILADVIRPEARSRVRVVVEDVAAEATL